MFKMEKLTAAQKDQAIGLNKFAMFPRSPEALNSFWSLKCAWLIGLFQKCLSIHLSVNVQILQKFVFHQPKAQADLIISAIIPLYAHLFSSILTLKDFRLVTKKN